jgi:hypothetical protein
MAVGGCSERERERERVVCAMVLDEENHTTGVGSGVGARVGHATLPLMICPNAAGQNSPSPRQTPLSAPFAHLPDRCVDICEQEVD